MSIFNIFKKKQKKKLYNIPEETNVSSPILPTIESKPPVPREKEERGSVEQLWLVYINGIKANNELKELFPDIIEKLEEDLSIEEIEELIQPIREYEKAERLKEDVFWHLAYEYNEAVKRKVEENYKTGKIEEFPLCKRIISNEYKNLKSLYPKEIEYLGELYSPVYKEYMEKNLSTDKSNFTDLTEFINFIDKIGFYEGSMISDKHFNVVNDALAYYGKEFHGDNLGGTVKEFYLKYDNYLTVKDEIAGEISILENENMNDEEKREAVIITKNKCGYYLSVKKGEYII